ncbi:luc7-like protein 3 [Diabrotica undecimpunctata]|uniref:luc7-like protein 3 n=1 Tax=Diabrotica undecimpunctata TaxID=50387 RepID=UPI003B6417D7
MAVTAAAQLLDELMGRNRNVAPNEKVREVDWEDSEFCQYYLVKFCPHDLFVNTRNDLGMCPKVHDEEARKLFHKVKTPHYKKLQYQKDFLRFCRSMMYDVERRIVKGKQRLALSASSKETASSSTQSPNQEQIKILNEKIEDLEAQAEQAGIAGKVEHAQGILKLCDQLKEDRDIILKHSESQLSLTAELASAQEKIMEVCEVCGAFLIVGDAQQRLEDHLMGKQHMGFTKLKTAVDEISELVAETKELMYGGRSTDNKDRETEHKANRGNRFKDNHREKKKEKTLNGDSDVSKDREEKEKENERDRKAREKWRSEDRNDKRDSHRDREPHSDRDRDHYRDREKERRHRESSHHHHYSHHRRKH